MITPEMCAGHFDDYPAMPVAMLMDGIHRLAVEHATKVTHPHVRLVTCVVEATQLAFAGEPVEFSVEQLTEVEVAPVDRAHYASLEI